MDKLQYLLYANGSKSLLVVLQALDAAGKDGVVRHLFSGMNPQPREAPNERRRKGRASRTLIFVAFAGDPVNGSRAGHIRK
jgi:hypothetical protein